MRRRTRRLLLGAHTRRMITIPVFVGAWIVGTLIFLPFVIPAVAVVDLFTRRKLTVARAILQGYVFLTAEFVCICWIAYLTVARFRMDDERWVAVNNQLVGWWARVQFDWARRIFRLKVEVEGADVLADGPYIMLVRHVSVIDNLIPAVFAVDGYHAKLRWVINWYLMRDPCIDIIGHRLRCSFVRGGTEQSPREMSRIKAMAADLRPFEGIVIYPEGTLFSPEKQARLLQRIARSRDEELSAFASQLKNTLPPRLGGTIALLEARRDLDVVFCSHSGLETSLDKASIVAGGLNGQQLRIKFWRVKAADIPAERPELRRWLFDQWRAVDDYVTAGWDSQAPC